MMEAMAEKFWELEKEQHVFEQRIQGFEFWLLIRVSLFAELCEKSNLFGGMAQDNLSSKSSADKLKFVLRGFVNYFTKNPFYTGRKKFFFWGHPRRKMVDNLWWDLYTDAITDELKDSFYTAEQSYVGKHFTPSKTNDIRFFDLPDFLIKYKASKKVFPFTEADLGLISALEKAIYIGFGIQYDLKNLISKRLLMHQGYVRYFTKLLKKVKPEMVFVVVAYQPASFGLINAAKSLDIPVAELQHGTIFKYHMGYNFPVGNFASAYTPDYIYSFGDFWKKQVTYALPEDNVVAIGYPFFSKMVNKFSIKPESKKILFISQGTIGVELFKFALALNKILPGDYTINYKLHSAEYPTWRENYIIGDEIIPFHVIDNDTINLYELIAESEYIIGVYSTALYEAIGFGKKVFLVNIPGVESMNTLINQNPKMLINIPEEVLNSLKIQNQESALSMRETVFKSNWKHNFKIATEVVTKTVLNIK